MRTQNISKTAKVKANSVPVCQTKIMNRRQQHVIINTIKLQSLIHSDANTKANYIRRKDLRKHWKNVTSPPGMLFSSVFQFRELTNK